MKQTQTKLLAIAVIILLASSSVAFLVVSFIGNQGENESVGVLRVACLGDSITEISNYPTYLQVLLGNQTVVKGFGVGGATVVRGSDRPYINQTVFQLAKEFQPHVVAILLGTNDARDNIYRDDIATFNEDYKALIAELQALQSQPLIWLALPTPLFNNSLSLNSTNLEQGVIPRIRQVSADTGLPTIDLYTPLSVHPEFFPDGVHPNHQGAQAIADEIYRAIING
jgi:acyl-CoA thioesterase I